MNAGIVATVARATAERVAGALATDAAVLVLGGDCTVELGTVAGAIAGTPSVGVVYIDLDTDLNTPGSTSDGALDWMGVAHMLGVEGTVPELVALGPRVPLLTGEQVCFFANDNVEPFERQLITQRGISQRGSALARKVQSELGNDPEFKAYEDARFALAGNLAVMQQGSRPSDADIMSIWLPLVPSVFSDTDQSAQIKWGLIDKMSGFTPSGGAGQTGPAAEKWERGPDGKLRKVGR